MLNLNCSVGIGSELSFAFVTNISIMTSIKELTSTALIDLPMQLKLGDKELRRLVSRRDRIIIRIGYGNELHTEFSGYVTRTDPNIPFRIHCEDNAFLLKEKAVNVSLRNPSLSDLLQAITPSGIDMRVAEMKFGQFRVANTTPAKVLDELRRNYGIDSFFRDEVLYVGVLPPANIVEYDFQKNIISSSLEWKEEDESRVTVRALSISPGNTTEDVTIGSGGEEVKYSFYNMLTAELKKRATEIYRNLNYDGYRGSFTTFGTPIARPADIVSLQDARLPERAGKYRVQKNQITFGQQGYRRAITVAEKIK